MEHFLALLPVALPWASLASPATEAGDATGESDASPVSRHFRLRKCLPGLRLQIVKK
jgi:hypothetical protein